MNSLKSLYLLLLFMFGFNIVSAQRAILDIDTTESGVLLPRIMLTASQTFGLSKVTSNTANSMLVYNTNTATNTGLSGQGYYYWNWDETTTTGTWVKMSTGDDKGDVSLIGTSYIGANAGPGGNGTKEGTQSNRNNIFLGKSAGVSNTTGDNNIFMGYQAGDSNTFGVNNIFMGYQAGYSNSQGSWNTLMGYRAGYDNSRGGSNIFIGYEAGYNNISNNNNIYLGNYAGYYNDGSGNIFLGRDAGEFLNNGTSNNTNSSNSVFIGMQTKSKEATTSNEIVIGHQAKGLGNNSAVIGNSSIAKTRLQGRVGIGTDNPLVGLHVAMAGATIDVGDNNKNSFGSGAAALNSWSGDPTGISILSSGGIAGSYIAAYSDKRLKNIKGISNQENDLQNLLGIEITDYSLKADRSNRVLKKVIAQQLKPYAPQVINKGVPDYIPSVFAVAKNIKVLAAVTKITTTKPHDFKVGDKIKLFIEDAVAEVLTEVTAISGNTFTIGKVLAKNKKVFVYGKKVDDILTVDYDALTTLNISATQALHKKIIAQNKEIQKLKEQNKELEELKAQNKAILKRLEDLEKK